MDSDARTNFSQFSKLSVFSSYILVSTHRNGDPRQVSKTYNLRIQLFDLRQLLRFVIEIAHDGRRIYY